MTKSKTGKPPRAFWTEAQVAHLRAHYADTPTADMVTACGHTINQILAKANALGLRKTKALISAMSRERMNGDHPGRASQFKPGQAPVNKGVKHPPGWAPGRMAQTQFKAGMRPATWVPVGTHVINPDGLLDRKVNDEPGPRHHRWHPVHRLVWVEANGPVPAGHVVVFKKGATTNVLEEITLDRIELITRAELMHRNSLHTQMPPELRQIVRLRARLTRHINQAAQAAQSTEGPTP
jgi:hypothetical protein